MPSTPSPQRACCGDAAVTWDIQFWTLRAFPHLHYSPLEWSEKDDYLGREPKRSGSDGSESTTLYLYHIPSASPSGLNLLHGHALMTSPGDVTYWGRRRGFPGHRRAHCEEAGRCCHGAPATHCSPCSAKVGSLSSRYRLAVSQGLNCAVARVLAGGDRGARMLGAGPDPRPSRL